MKLRALLAAAPLFLLVALCAQTAAALEPPTAGQVEQYWRDGTLAARAAAAKRFGNHRVSPELAFRFQQRLARMGMAAPPVQPAPPLGWRNMPTTGTVKVLALLIDFSDYPAGNTAASINGKLFGDGSGGYPLESLRNYYRRSSYGQLEITGNTLGWYRAGARSSVSTTQAGREALIEAVVQRHARLRAVRQRRRRLHRLPRRRVDRPSRRLGVLLVGLLHVVWGQLPASGRCTSRPLLMAVGVLRLSGHLRPSGGHS
jgi:hypothetical protein